MWQEIAVIIIGILTIFFIARRIFRIFTSLKAPEDPCRGCSGCALKEELANSKKKSFVVTTPSNK